MDIVPLSDQCRDLSSDPETEKKESVMTQVCSDYSQLLQLFPLGQFADAFKQHRLVFCPNYRLLCFSFFGNCLGSPVVCRLGIFQRLSFVSIKVGDFCIQGLKPTSSLTSRSSFVAGVTVSPQRVVQSQGLPHPTTAARALGASRWMQFGRGRS